MQNFLGFLFVVIWVGGIIFLGVRVHAKENAYLDRRPQLDDAPFNPNQYAAMLTPRRWGGPYWRVVREPQFDPEVERLRQDLWRRTRYMVLWWFGFPAIVTGVMVFLIVAGFLR